MLVSLVRSFGLRHDLPQRQTKNSHRRMRRRDAHIKWNALTQLPVTLVRESSYNLRHRRLNCQAGSYRKCGLTALANVAVTSNTAFIKNRSLASGEIMTTISTDLLPACPTEGSRREEQTT